MQQRLILVLAAVAAMSACSGARERRLPRAENSAQRPDLTLPETTSLSDTSFSVSSRSPEPVSPVEQAPSSSRPRPRPRPAKPVRPPAGTETRTDTSTRAYAPEAGRDSAPPPDTVVADSTGSPGPDSGAVVPAETAPPLPDTVASATSDTTSHPDTTFHPVEAPAAQPAADSAPPGSSAGVENTRILPIGTEIHAALDDSISSRRDTVGQTVSAHVMENVTSADGRTLIPAGTPVQFTVTRLRAAKSKESQGRLALRADGIALNGKLRPMKAEVRPVPRELRGRGVTGSEAAKVGAGAVGGAVLGRVVGGSTKGAVIGGVAGAAAGAVVANQTATRDVVVKAKTPVLLVLTAPLTPP